MNQLHVPRRASQCAHNQEALDAGVYYVSYLQSSGEEWVRLDYCAACWELVSEEKEKDGGHFWRGKVPPKEAKQLSPDEKAFSLFRKWASEDPEKHASMLFLLTLYLERKQQIVRRVKGKRKMICEIPETGETFILPLSPFSPDEGESLTAELASQMAADG